MSDAMNKLTVMKERRLSDQISVLVVLKFGHEGPLVTWNAPPSRSPESAGLSVLTDTEAHQYGIVLGEAYADFARISGGTLMHVTDKRCGPGLLESGAAEVQDKGGAAIAVFVGKVKGKGG